MTEHKREHKTEREIEREMVKTRTESMGTRHTRDWIETEMKDKNQTEKDMLRRAFEAIGAGSWR